jgi:2-amino-4-hydroxy-6-hydroxymethyldihydropteridine diphosphokinase
MARTFLGLGSNTGDRAGFLARARARLAVEGPVRSSALFETEPVGLDNAPGFLNGAIELDTNLGPEELLVAAGDCEAELGRDRATPELRTVDIDLLLYGPRRVDRAELTVPHPRMRERRFVLEPLAELAPDARLPGDGRPVRELLEALPAGRGEGSGPR